MAEKNQQEGFCFFKSLMFLAIIISGTSCASLFNIASIGYSSSKAIKGTQIRKEARSLERDSLSIEASQDLATYYLYRRGSFYGVAASCLIYDNNQYIGVVNNKTFEKVDKVQPGAHAFTSEENSDKSVTINLEKGKTYILRVKQSYKLRDGELFIMDEETISKELKKEKYFKEMYLKYGLDSKDISYK